MRATKVSGKQFANGRIIGKNQNMSKQPSSKDQASIDSSSIDKDIDKDAAADKDAAESKSDGADKPHTLSDSPSKDASADTSTDMKS
jgi:hypothetical protein